MLVFVSGLSPTKRRLRILTAPPAGSKEQSPAPGWRPGRGGGAAVSSRGGDQKLEQDSPLSILPVTMHNGYETLILEFQAQVTAPLTVTQQHQVGFSAFDLQQFAHLLGGRYRLAVDFLHQVAPLDAGQLGY